MIELGRNRYGKAAIHVVRVARNANGHRVRDVIVAIALEGDFTAAALGQSVWIDFLSRDLLRSGALVRAIEEDAVVGVTSNPTILEKAPPMATPTTRRSATTPTATPSGCSSTW